VNSLGQRGDASWEVSSEYGGDVRGLWDGILFQGRRQGNIVTFSIDGGQRSCNDYQVRAEISPPGNTANFSYQAHNHCSGNRYTGTEEVHLRSILGTNETSSRPNEQASKPAKSPQGAKPAPPPSGSSSQQGSVSGSVQPAVLIKQVPPQYPPIAKAAKITGVVRLHVTIGTDGSVKEVSVIWGNPILAQAAVDAVRQWRYSPVLRNGKPTEAETEASINFALDQR
jgi:TonB family protein